MFSTILTGSGDVLLYWPHRGNLQHFIDANDRASNKQGDGNEARASEDGTIPCVMSVIQADPYRLPAIPALPNLPDAGLTEEQLDRETKLIKIAAYDNNLVGLTNKGHVLKFGGLGSRKEYLRSRWEYLPNFSEAARLCSHPTFAGQNAVCEPPKTMRITHMCFACTALCALSHIRSLLQGSQLRRPHGRSIHQCSLSTPDIARSAVPVHRFGDSWGLPFWRGDLYRTAPDMGCVLQRRTRPRGSFRVASRRTRRVSDSRGS